MTGMKSTGATNEPVSKNALFRQGITYKTLCSPLSRCRGSLRCLSTGGCEIPENEVLPVCSGGLHLRPTLDGIPLYRYHLAPQGVTAASFSASKDGFLPCDRKPYRSLLVCFRSRALLLRKYSPPKITASTIRMIQVVISSSPPSLALFCNIRQSFIKGYHCWPH